MKTRLLTIVCALAVGLSATTSVLASDSGPATVIADTVVVRPACLVATAIGSVFFVATLPLALVSKSVKKTANTLVVKPAQATFTRPLGDMDALVEY